MANKRDGNVRRKRSYILSSWNNNVIEGDALTQFLTENISDKLVKDFIKEEADAE